MAIPIITTTVRTGHNPGDTFISVGMQYLFERVLGPQRWLLVDRFHAAGFRRYRDQIREAPFIVYGGMPQYNNYDDWSHWYDDRMWRQYILGWGLRVFTMAGGAGFSHADIDVDAYVNHCLKSRRTQRIIQQRVPASLCFTVRDQYAHALLNALGIDNHHLPCTATWASRMWHIDPANDRPHLLIVPPHPRHTGPHHGHPRPSRADRHATYVRTWTSLYEALKRRDAGTRVLCHGYDEWLLLRHAMPNEDLWFHGDSFTLLREYARAHTVVSARLHGSLPAFGIPGTSVVNVAVDVRGMATDILPKIVTARASDVTPENVGSLIDRARPSAAHDLDEWEDHYARVIESALPR